LALGFVSAVGAAKKGRQSCIGEATRPAKRAAGEAY
jgi:hypothetical protein